MLGYLYTYYGQKSYWISESIDRYITSFAEYNSKFYCSGDNGILYELNGNSWVAKTSSIGTTYRVLNNGLLPAFGGLYAIISSNSATCLCKWNDVNAWETVGTIASGPGQCLVLFDGSLYTCLKDGTLYQWNGVDTLTSVSSSIGSGSIAKLVVHDGYLYCVHDGGLFKWNGVDSYTTQIVNDGNNSRQVASDGTYIYYGHSFADSDYPVVYRWTSGSSWVTYATGTDQRFDISDMLFFGSDLFIMLYDNTYSNPSNPNKVMKVTATGFEEYYANSDYMFNGIGEFDSDFYVSVDEGATINYYVIKIN